MAKRPCHSSSENPNLPSCFSQMDHVLLSFLSLADSSPPVSLDLSFDRLLDSTPSDADQALLIDRAQVSVPSSSVPPIAPLVNVLRFIIPPPGPSLLISPSRCFRC